jgi:hypothetical protein
MEKHLENGNCFEVVWECQICGADVLCDVCHEHDEPRGECTVCEPCNVFDCDPALW